MNVPGGAVRRKMELEGIEERLIVAVLMNCAPAPRTPLPGGAAPVATKTEGRASVSSLTDKEEGFIKKYRDMKKMSVPEGAIRAKMRQESVEERLIDAVLAASAQAEEGPAKKALKDEEEKTVKKYRMMIGMNVPVAAVRQKMEQDALPAHLIDHLCGAGASPKAKKKKAPAPDAKAAEPAAPPPIVLSAEEEKVAKKYRTMLKMSVPTGAVRNKMTMEDVDPKIMEALLGPDPAAPKPKPPRPPPSAEKPYKMSAEDEKAVKKFRMMLKMSVPAGAVRQKMMMDKIDPKIIGAVLGKEEGTPSGRKSSGKKGMKSPTKGLNKQEINRRRSLVNLHWTKLDSEKLEDSMWNKKKGTGDDASVYSKNSVEPSDIHNLEEMFQKKKAMARQKSGGSGAGQKKKAAGLIEANRCNNINISLKAFKDFPTLKDLVGAIAELDPENRIAGDRIQFLKGMLPTTQELKDVARFRGDDADLLPAEKFFRNMLGVKRLESKLLCMATIDTLPPSVKELTGRFRTITTVCRQCMGSERLQQLLETVLSIGNIMNEGTMKGGASGFKMDSLLKLTQTKSVDGRMTVIDYIVMTFAAKNQREVLDLASEFPEVQPASKMLMSEMVLEARTGGGDLNKCKAELIRMKNEATDYIRGSPGISRLENFIKEATSTIKTLETERDDAIKTCQELSKYFGEDGNEQNAVPIFGILFEFANLLSAAVKKYDQRKAAEEKAAKRERVKREKQQAKMKLTGKKPGKKTSGSPDGENPRSALLDSISGRGRVASDASSTGSGGSGDPRSAMMQAIQGRKAKAAPTGDGDPRSAMMQAIQGRKAAPTAGRSNRKVVDSRVSSLSYSEDGDGKRDGKRKPIDSRVSSLSYSEDGNGRIKQMGSDNSTLYDSENEEDPHSALLGAIKGRKSSSSSSTKKDRVDPRSAMMQAIQGRKAKPKSQVSPHSALLGAIQSKKTSSSTNEGGDPRSAMLEAIQGGTQPKAEADDDSSTSKTDADPRRAMLEALHSRRQL